MPWSALEGCLQGPGPWDPQEQALFHKDHLQVICAWLGRQKNGIPDCNEGNCYGLLVPLSTQCINAAYPSGLRGHFCKEGWERVSAVRPQPTRDSVAYPVSHAPPRCSGVRSPLVRWDFYAALGEQNTHGSESFNRRFVSCSYGPAKRVFLTVQKREMDI